MGYRVDRLSCISLSLVRLPSLHLFSTSLWSCSSSRIGPHFPFSLMPGYLSRIGRCRLLIAGSRYLIGISLFPAFITSSPLEA